MDERTRDMMKTIGYREDFDPDNRVVKQENIVVGKNTYFISTVDLGLDHSFIGGEPLYYETMVFIRKDDGEVDFSEQYVDRYTTKTEAIVGHSWVVNQLKAGNFTVGECGYISFE